MAVFLYGALLLALYPVYRAACLFSDSLRRFHLTRREGRAQLAGFFAEKSELPTYWLHGSSAGELDQALGVARELRRRGPARILITVFSLSVKRLPVEADLACYLPLDLPFSWRFLSRGPDVFITFTWDVFPNLLARLHNLGTRNYLASAALADDSWRLRWAGFLQSFYRDLSGIGTVDEPNRRRFLKLLARDDRVQTTGDTRYDTIFHKLENAPLPPEDAQILERCRPLLILASTYKACDGELLPLLPGWMNSHPDLDVWIFPHHVDENRLRECEAGLEKTGIHAMRYSHLNQKEGVPRVVLVDRLGLLARWYAKARYCYVGGGFHNRIHNTAEPAALGAIILTGPRIEDSPIAMQLEMEGTLSRRSSGAEIFKRLEELETDEAGRATLSRHSRSYLEAQRGASVRFLQAFNL